jgi:hypothetical protein
MKKGSNKFCLDTCQAKVFAIMLGQLNFSNPLPN